MEINEKTYILRDDVQVFYTKPDEIRFRKGIWNYVDAIINLTNQSTKVKEIFGIIVEKLLGTRECNLDVILEDSFPTTEEKNEIIQLFNDIQEKNFFYRDDLTINNIIEQIYGFSLKINEYNRPVLFFADSEYSKDIAKTIAQQSYLPIDIMGKELFDDIFQSDLTIKTEVIETVQKLKDFGQIFKPYSCIVGVFGSLNISFLRNLNSVLLHLEKPLPLICGFIDGPFLSIFSILPPDTGCFGCYENRIIARMQDMAVYYEFFRKNKKHVFSDNLIRSSFPLVHLLTSIVIMESLLYSATNIIRTNGRVINIYLPVLEIQIQDILRVPYCSACGFIAKPQVKELYTSSENIIRNMIKKIEVKN